MLGIKEARALVKSGSTNVDFDTLAPDLKRFASALYLLRLAHILPGELIDPNISLQDVLQHQRMLILSRNTSSIKIHQKLTLQRLVNLPLEHGFYQDHLWQYPFQVLEDLYEFDLVNLPKEELIPFTKDWAAYRRAHVAHEPKCHPTHLFSFEPCNPLLVLEEAIGEDSHYLDLFSPRSLVLPGELAPHDYSSWAQGNIHRYVIAKLQEKLTPLELCKVIESVAFSETPLTAFEWWDFYRHAESYKNAPFGWWESLITRHSK